jgi:hypothetical protein
MLNFGYQNWVYGLNRDSIRYRVQIGIGISDSESAATKDYVLPFFLNHIVCQILVNTVS